MSGSVTNQRKVNKVGAGCAQSLLTNPQPHSELPDQWGTGGSGWGVVTCCHGAPTFLSRPPDVDVSVPILTCAGHD